MLEHLPKGGVCAEVGIFKCDFSEQILSVLQPEKLHLIDIDPASIEIAGRRFQKEIGEGRVEIHHGDSSSILARFPDQSLDWIYIDGDHNYPGVKKDLEQARVKVKEERADFPERLHLLRHNRSCQIRGD
jgi:spermidine synthase